MKIMIHRSGIVAKTRILYRQSSSSVNKVRVGFQLAKSRINLQEAITYARRSSTLVLAILSNQPHKFVQSSSNVDTAELIANRMRQIRLASVCERL